MALAEHTLHEHHWPVYGHDWAVDHLRKSMAHGRVRHAYLIAGAESVGKETLARAFAMALNCTHADEAARPCGECRSCRTTLSGNHPDIVYSQLDPTSGALKIEEIRGVIQRLALKPFEARYRVAILPDFDHAAPRAQDALLKTLEEPTSHAILILLASSLDPILPTITSRSQIIHLRAVSAGVIEAVLKDKFGADAQTAALLAHLCGGRLGWAVRALEDAAVLEQRQTALDLLEQILMTDRIGRFALAEDLSRDKLSLIPLLELWQTYLRDLILLCEGSALEPANLDRADHLDALAHRMSGDEALIALRATQNLLNVLNTNANTRLALEVMLLDYPGLRRA